MQLNPNSTTTILSVCPIAFRSTERHHRITVSYECPAAQRDKIVHRRYAPEWLSSLNKLPQPGTPIFEDSITSCEAGRGYTLVTIPDTWQFTRDTTVEDQNAMVPRGLSSKDNADALVREWTNCVSAGNGAVGVVVIAGDQPTADEYDRVIALQKELSHRLMAEATSFYGKDDLKSISDVHRAFALWMGADNVPWLPKFEQVEMKHCKACGERIRKVALKCKECAADLVGVWKDLMAMGIPVNEQDDPVAIGIARQALDHTAKRKAA